MVWIWPATLALAACGGGGGGAGSGIDPRLARLNIYEAQKLRVLGDPGAGVMGMAVSGPGAIPDSGTVQFDGFATIRVEADNPLVLFGDATLRVTFDTDQVSGQLDGFFGTNSGGQAVDYAGAITIDGGVSASNLQLDYGGSLTGSSDTLIFDGTATGSLRGNPVAAVSAADLEARVDHNGTPTDATLLLVAETVP